jgi:D-sedoheptulose 7-phosphate isomerase
MNPGTNGHASTGPAALSAAQSRSDDLATLYPFLYAHSDNVGQGSPTAGDLEAVLTEVRRSTVDKVHQIVALRREVLAQ